MSPGQNLGQLILNFSGMSNCVFDLNFEVVSPVAKLWVTRSKVKVRGYQNPKRNCAYSPEFHSRMLK